jgi:hypothetical protein
MWGHAISCILGAAGLHGYFLVIHGLGLINDALTGQEFFVSVISVSDF